MVKTSKTRTKPVKMETLFTEKDSIPYVRGYLRSVSRISFLVVSAPFLVLFIRRIVGEHDNKKWLIFMGIATIVMFMVAVVFHLLSNRIAERLARRRSWYMKYLYSERRRFSRILEYYDIQGRACYRYMRVVKALLLSKGDREEKRRNMIANHRRYMNQLQTAVSNLPRSEQKKAEREYEIETDKFLDRLSRLEDQPLTPENVDYLLDLNESLSQAEKRMAEYKTLYSETKARIDELDRLIAGVEQVEVHA